MNKEETKSFTSYFKGLDKSDLEKLVETIRKEENAVINELKNWHQIVDAQKLLTLLHKRAAIQDVIEGRVLA